eukprot:605370-Pelagomonas_calceolata.AAC.4
MRVQGGGGEAAAWWRSAVLVSLRLVAPASILQSIGCQQLRPTWRIDAPAVGSALSASAAAESEGAIERES